MKLAQSIKFYTCVLVALLVVSSCGSNSLKEADLIGTYVYNEGGYKIDLRDDGTYRHYYTAASGHILEKTGTWELHNFGKEIRFSDFSFIPDTVIIQWNSKLRVEKKRIDLMYDWKDDLFYRRLRTIKK